MEKSYKFIRITEDAQTQRKTKAFNVVNKTNGALLGTIEFYPPWRRYCLMPYDGIVFSADCLLNIVDFISLISKEKAI